MNTYALCKKLISAGKYDKADLKSKLDVFLLADRITQEQFTELAKEIN